MLARELSQSSSVGACQHRVVGGEARAGVDDGDGLAVRGGAVWLAARTSRNIRDGAVGIAEDDAAGGGTR